jgi:uncharacterized membrane protein
MGRFFSASEEEEIVAAIAAAEKQTSGEIRVHIEKKCNNDPVGRAFEVFKKLGMHQTQLHNGVLLYVALDSHHFAIIGDEGINNVVETDFWDCTRDLMLEQFRNGRIKEGMLAGIENAGRKLKQYFPAQRDDSNELSNDISFG